VGLNCASGCDCRDPLARVKREAFTGRALALTRDHVTNVVAIAQGGTACNGGRYGRGPSERVVSVALTDRGPVGLIIAMADHGGGSRRTADAARPGWVGAEAGAVAVRVVSVNAGRARSRADGVVRVSYRGEPASIVVRQC